VVALRARGAENKLPCKSVDLLHLCSVAFSSEDAKNRAELLQQTKKTFTNPVINANHSDLLQKLMTEDNGQQDVDVVVMDAWTANYMVAVPKFRGKLVLHESTFSVGSLVMGVSRPEGRENPLFLLLQSAVFEVVHGAMMDEYAELIHKWFGQESVMDLAEYQARIQKAIVQTNIGISLCLGGVVLLWSAGDESGGGIGWLYRAGDSNAVCARCTLVCGPDLTFGEFVQRQFIIISARSKRKSFANVLRQPCLWAGACAIATACLCLCVCILPLPLHALLTVALSRSLWL
jgi:hypothetical protein